MEVFIGNARVLAFVCIWMSSAMNCGKHNVIGIEKFRNCSRKMTFSKSRHLARFFGPVAALVMPLHELTMATTRYWKLTRFERIYRKGTAGGTRGPR
jgi:hypothetical protein